MEEKFEKMVSHGLPVPDLSERDKEDYYEILSQLKSYSDRIPALPGSLKACIIKAYEEDRKIDHCYDFNKPIWMGRQSETDTQGEEWAILASVYGIFSTTQFDTFFWKPEKANAEFFMVGWGHVLDDEYVLVRGMMFVTECFYAAIFPSGEIFLPFLKEIENKLSGDHSCENLCKGISMEKFEIEYLLGQAIVSRKTGDFVTVS